MSTADLNILVVEDDEFQRHMLVKILRNLRVKHVSHVAGVKQFIEFTRLNSQVKFDIVICDLSTPEVEGSKFLRQLGEEHANASIILTSALAGHRFNLLEKMAETYGITLLSELEKPIKPAVFYEILTRHCRQYRPVTNDLRRKIFTLDEINQAIDCNQIEPYFQPKIELKSGKLVGAEALARWVHPTLGCIVPNQFIPQLENNGAINEFTNQIVRKSANACRKLFQQGANLQISINLSSVSLNDASLANRIHKIVLSEGVKPENFVFEVSESTAMTNVAIALKNLTHLSMNGFTLSIDDFANGFSGIHQLTRVAFRELKIDHPLVQHLSESATTRAKIKSCIELAHQFNVRCVAEGVETQKEWDTLYDIGCDMAQGYLIAKPMDFSNLLNYERVCLLEATSIG